MSVATPALPVRAERLWAALLAATLMNLPLGSVYAFSVLLRPIEQELAIPRSALSLVFGLATVGFTVGSVGAAFLYRAAPAPILVLLSALAAAAGLLTAAAASGLAQLLVGYGIVFGTGGGVAYILLQQGVNMLVQRRRGLANGYIVALYPMGAMIATPAMCHHAEIEFSAARSLTPSRLMIRWRARITVYVTKITCLLKPIDGNQRFRSDVVKIAAP